MQPGHEVDMDGLILSDFEVWDGWFLTFLLQLLQ